jgi:hypothetical protein
MNPFQKFAAISIAALSFASFDAAAAIDPAASVVLVRTSCNDGAGGTLNNCFTDPVSVNTWMNNTRKPTQLNPLEVQFGPGIFGQAYCGGGATSGLFVSFRGAGIDKTTLASLTTFSSCANATFSDMTVGGQGLSYGVTLFHGGTKTTWTNVRLAGSWIEYCTSGSGGRHDWFGSKVQLSRPGESYQVRCDQSWFYGSDITASGSLQSADVAPFSVEGSELHVYGSVIRARGTGTVADYGIWAVRATGGEVHIHGTGIDVIAVNNASAAITALRATNGATIHADVSAYNMRTGPGGSVIRLDNDNGSGHIHAPYVWQHVPDPATAPNYTTVNGADQTTVTVGTSDGHPHTAVYSSTCPANARWYDTTDKVCRSQ